MKKAVRTTLAPLAGLAKRRTHLAHKTHSWVHQNVLLFGALLQAFIRSVVAMATDFGTEAGIVRTQPIPLDQLYPHAAQPKFEEEGHAEEGGDDQDMLDWRHGLFIPDALHILHVLCGDLLEIMPTFKEVWPLFKNIAVFTKHKLNRDVVVATCFDDEDGRVCLRGRSTLGRNICWSGGGGPCATFCNKQKARLSGRRHAPI